MNLELLSPGGSPQKLRFAAAYGADAVYAGAPGFSLRNKGENFSSQDFADSITWLHDRGKKLYLAANIFFHNEDLEPFQEYLRTLPPGFDGIILSDLGMIDHVRDRYPHLDVHVSTQANTTNRASARFYERLGVKRLVLARELSLPEIREIRDAVDLELEAFVHGAMCMAYSGRCLLSNYFSSEPGRTSGYRDANGGDCTQVCRWEFALTEKTRPGEFLPVEEDAYGTAILSSRDLNLAGNLPDLIAAGVNSFKIEGRMKSAWYAAVTARVYRHSLDRAAQGRAPDPGILAQLDRISHREYSTGFYYRQDRASDAGGQLSASRLRNGTQDQLLLALVESVHASVVTAIAMNPIRAGDLILVMNPGSPDGELTRYTLKVEGEVRTLVRPTERFELELEEPVNVEPFSLFLKDLS